MHADCERLYVGDTGNCRLLIWDRMPVKNGLPADADNNCIMIWQGARAVSGELAGVTGAGLIVLVICLLGDQPPRIC